MRNVIVDRRRSIALAFALIATAAVVVVAANPHFVGRVTSTLLEGNLLVSFREVGLGSGQNLDYVAVADSTVTYVCVDNSGQCPNAANMVTVMDPVSATGTFSPQRGGQINQSLTLNPPSAGSFSCPAGQSLFLADVAYVNVTITDIVNGVTAAATPSAISATYFACPL